MRRLIRLSSEVKPGRSTTVSDSDESSDSSDDTDSDSEWLERSEPAGAQDSDLHRGSGAIGSPVRPPAAKRRRRDIVSMGDDNSSDVDDEATRKSAFLTLRPLVDAMAVLGRQQQQPSTAPHEPTQQVSLLISDTGASSIIHKENEPAEISSDVPQLMHAEVASAPGDMDAYVDAEVHAEHGPIVMEPNDPASVTAAHGPAQWMHADFEERDNAAHAGESEQQSVPAPAGAAAAGYQ